MAIIRNLASGMLKGKIGDTSYFVSQSRQIARQALNNSNYGENASRTDVQQNRRVRWANLVNFYSGNKSWMRKAYENLKPGVSVFNRFMQLNIASASVALTKSEAQAKVWIPASYRVSQGSLQTISNGAHTTLATDLMGSTFSIGELSTSLIENNANLQEGDAIVCVQFFGTTAAPGATSGIVPASYAYSEIVLNTASEESLPNGWKGAGGILSKTALDGAVAIVYIHTRKSAGKLFVSTEDMAFIGSQSGADAWRSDAQFALAIKSYGESTSVPLAPGGTSDQQSGNDSSSGGNTGGGDEPGIGD